MKITRLSCVAGVIALMSILFANEGALARNTTPNWFSGQVVYKEIPNRERLADCKYENRTVLGVLPRVYTTNDVATIQEVCVYHANGYEYAYYARDYYIYPGNHHAGTLHESGVAFSFNSTNEMLPSLTIGNRDSDVQLYMGASKAFLQQSTPRGGIDYYKDLRAHIIYELNGTISLDGHPDYSFRDKDYAPLPAEGVGVSSDKQWVSFASPNLGIFILDTSALRLKRISNNYEIYSHTFPRPDVVTSPSNGGKYVLIGGWAVDPEVYVDNGSCGAYGETFLRDYYHNLPIANKCESRNVKEAINANSPAIGNTPYRRFMNAQMSSDGGHFDYYDGYKDASVYAQNMRPLSNTRYLALGDSYASGEGDLPGAHETYYILGTNVVGNYPLVPQEMCHISSRSYPFLLAAKMGFHDDTMKSVACSGAVADDVMTYDTNNFNRIIADNYMGQGRVGAGGPRLVGTGNVLGFQDEARDKVLPGRVQQIEHVQKTKPEAVTIMMGGNDLGFGGIMASCANLWNWGRLDDDCEQTTSTGEVKIVRAIQSMYPKWVHMYKNIKASTSSGKVYVMGYPHFLATDNICSEMAGLYTRSERQSINQTIDYVNATIKNAALDAGVWYIDITNALEGKELCGKSNGMTGFDDLAYQAIMSEYMHYKNTTDENIKKYGLAGRVYNMNPTFLQTYQANRSIEAAAGIAANPSSAIWATFQQLIHPNNVGHQALYNRIAAGLGPDLLDSEECNAIVTCPTFNADGSVASAQGIPSPETYIEGIAMSATGEVYVNGEGVISLGRKIDNTIAKSAGESYQIGVDLLTKLKVDTSKPIKLSIHSDPTHLGTLTKDGDVYSLTATLPNSTAAGIHALHVAATTLDGTILDIVRYVMVVGPNGDIDDDGILDQVDMCAFGVPSNKDDDGDGIADNCDMFISTGSQKNDENLVLAPSVGRTADGILPLLTSADQKDTQEVQNSAMPVIPRTGDTLNRQVAKLTNKTQSSEPPKWNIVWLVTGLIALLIGLLYGFRKRRT